MQDLPYSSIPAMLKDKAGAFPHRMGISYKKSGEFISLRYGHFYERVLMAARGLKKLGVRAGEKVAILSENRAGWVISDLGIQCVGAAPVPIYPTNTPEQVAYILNHCGARVVFVSNRLQYQKLHRIREAIPAVEQVISYERFIGERCLPVYTLYQLSEISHPLSEQERAELEAAMDAVGPEDLATIIYTSGTTGTPKGVMLTQSNLLSDAALGTRRVGGIRPDEILLSFLPLSHALERTIGYYVALLNGCHIVFAESIEKVPENILEVRPTMMITVPRLLEKIHSRIYESVHQMPPARRRLFHWALETGRTYAYRKYVEKASTADLEMKYRLADRLVFRRIRERFGGRMRFFVSGGAPLEKSINEFFWSIGLPVLEGYGLTETSPAISINTLQDLRFGSVGKVFDETEVRLEDDGELLIRGPMVMKGYYQDEENTRETLNAEGWFRTGDIARIDEEGFIYIVDRKKEIIVTAGGKNIAPHPIEGELQLDKYISQAIVCGDRRPYLVALLTPNMERLLEYAQGEKLAFLDMADLVSNARVRQLYEERIAQVNSRLPSYETIKKFVLLPRDFSIEGGELTPTLKKKRKVILEKHADQIESLYLENGVAKHREFTGEVGYVGN